MKLLMRPRPSDPWERFYHSTSFSLFKKQKEFYCFIHRSEFEPFIPPLNRSRLPSCSSETHGEAKTEVASEEGTSHQKGDLVAMLTLTHTHTHEALDKGERETNRVDIKQHPSDALEAKGFRKPSLRVVFTFYLF